MALAVLPHPVGQVAQAPVLVLGDLAAVLGDEPGIGLGQGLGLLRREILARNEGMLVAPHDRLATPRDSTGDRHVRQRTRTQTARDTRVLAARRSRSADLEDPRTGRTIQKKRCTARARFHRGAARPLGDLRLDRPGAGAKKRRTEFKRGRMHAALIFPGQGSQAVGMGQALFAAVPAASAVFEEVDAALGEPLSRADLRRARRAAAPDRERPARPDGDLDRGAARARDRERPHGSRELCRFVAGHSLGEYSALAAAGSLSIGDAARLLRLRGQAMQAAVPVGEGAMAAMLGLELAEVEAIAAEAAAERRLRGRQRQRARPGRRQRRARRGRAGRRDRQGQGRRRSMMLPVSAPFHCRLMAPAADAVQAALAGIELRAPAVPVDRPT